MDWINYHHLLYFWTVVREGSVSAASRALRLAQPTVSSQLKSLEESLEVQLFHRKGNKLVLTDVGAHVFRYADEIFALGRDLRESIAGLPTRRNPRFVVGVADEMPKLVVQRLLEPAFALPEEIRLVCYEDRQDRLLADLAVHSLDMVLAEAPVAPGSSVRAYSHLLGESSVTLFAEPKLARRVRKGFPRSLDDVPLLVPIENTLMRRQLARWFEAQGVRPRIRAEFQDSALLPVFGRVGAGVFPAPTVIAAEVRAQHGVAEVAEIADVREKFYAITVDRKLRHPAQKAITENARRSLFSR